MTLVVCLDDNNGMMFNKRRQSADRMVDQAVLELSAEGKLYIDSYSAKKFPDACLLDGDHSSLFFDNDVCFAETAYAVTASLHYADRIIIYRWNKIYPADMYLPIDLTASAWKKLQTTELTGYSHEKITQEVYIRE